MHSFEVHSNESACRKSGRLGMEQVLTPPPKDIIFRRKSGDSETDNIPRFPDTNIPRHSLPSGNLTKTQVKGNNRNTETYKIPKCTNNNIYRH